MKARTSLGATPCFQRFQNWSTVFLGDSFPV